MKSPFELLARISPPPTAEDVAAAARLGVTLDEYRAAKLQQQIEEARAALPPDPRPADIVREERIAQRLRREPGLLKPRNEAPNLLVSAAETPGEVAKLILFVIVYLVAMIAVIVIGGETVHQVPGIFQCMALGILVLPVMWITNRLWEAIGEGARDLCRLLVRLWPLTLVALLFALGLIKILLGGAR